MSEPVPQVPPAAPPAIKPAQPAHAPHQVGDDYDDCERSHHLDFIGGFK